MGKKILYRVPTDLDYARYDGAHCPGLWKQCIKPWVCPGCGRTRREIMRWTRRYTPYPGCYPYEGWMAGLHCHHDHGTEFGMKQRFIDAIICDHCNAVDAQIRRRYPVIPLSFSYSPAEIRKIVIPSPHRGHQINYHVAWQLYCLESNPSFYETLDFG